MLSNTKEPVVLENQLKPSSAFRLKKQFKRLLANETDNSKRALLKQAFIQAQLEEEKRVKND